MKRPLAAIGIFLFSTIMIGGGSIPAAHAGNSSVEATLQNYGDLSMFYQALLNTGVLNELKENEHYTLFAPTNAALAQIRPQGYPCFYAVECRPQIAAMMRNHIIEGRHDPADLVTYGNGIRTLGTRFAYVDEPFLHNYTVDNHNILSSTELNGNIVYRIDGVITTPQELAQFQNVQIIPTANVVTTEKTTVRNTYVAPSATPTYPAGNMVREDITPEGSTQTTTITRTYTTEQ